MRERDIAVVGMACILPDAADLRTYWRHIINGHDAIRALPRDRWPGSRNTTLPAGHFAHIGFDRGGFIPTPFLFDALRFRVMPRVAQDGDVDQFVLLQVIDDALRDAGIGPDNAQRHRADLVVGRGGYTSNKMMEIFLRADLIDRMDRHLRTRLSTTERDDLATAMLAGMPELDVDSMASSIPNLVASRAANRLDLCGAAYTVDAACASSLIAVEETTRRLRDGVCDIGIACGINFTNVPSFWYLFDKIHAVSPTGRIAPFDRRADGMLIGEGAGAAVLKRVDDAVRDGDRVYAVIRGVGSASDGRSTGILAPSSRGQVAALERAYHDAGIEPDTIDLLEAHGTGTVQGDAAEIETLVAVYGKGPASHPTRALGSVKSMIGHTMPAAGIAALIKTAMALSSRVLPPTLNCAEPHPALQETSFFVNTLPRPWVHDDQRPPRRAGVNAFGFGGINAHVILEEVRPTEVPVARVAVGGLSGSHPAPLAAAARPPLQEQHRRSAGVEAAVDVEVAQRAAPAEAAATPFASDAGTDESGTQSGRGLCARPTDSSRHRPTEMLAFTGATPVEVAAKLRRLAAFLERDRQPHPLEDISYTLLDELQPSDPCRLAVVIDMSDTSDPSGWSGTSDGFDADSKEADESALLDQPTVDDGTRATAGTTGNDDHGGSCEDDEHPAAVVARLLQLAAAAERGELASSEADGLFWNVDATAPAGKVVALFPGQGFPGLVGHYPEHLMEFCLHLPRVRRVFDRIEARDRHPQDPLPSSYLLVPPAHLPEAERARLRSRFGTKSPTAGLDADSPLPAPHERRLSAMGMLMSNWVSWLILEPFRIPFSMACGQSLGDISALCAADMVDFEEVVPRLWPYLSIDDRLPGTGCLAFVGASEETLTPLLADAGDVVIALHLSPETQIVGGTDEAVDRLIADLRRRNVMVQKLPFPPIHTPRLTELQKKLQEMEGEPVPLRRPRMAVYSTITESPMPDEVSELRSLVASNISRPVRFWQTVRRMYDDGGRIFVQAGTGTLAGNIRAILPGSDAVTLALDVDYRHPITQLQRLCATLFTRGVPLELRALFEAREPRRLDLDAPRPAATPVGVPLTFYWPPLEGRAAGAASTDQPVASPLHRPTSHPDRRGEQAGTLPLLGQVLRFEAGRSIVTTRTFDLDEDLFLEDHTFIHADGVKPLEERFPVVPLTMTLEMMAEVAACLAPGLGIIAIADVRARKWIALDGVRRTDVRVEGKVAGEADGVVQVHTEVFVDERVVASATLRLSRRYRLGVELTFHELVQQRPFPLDVKSLYDERYLFHGPRFQCVAAVDSLGDQGIVGEIIAGAPGRFFASHSTPQMILDPVALDGAGQMFGAIFFGQDLYMLPVAIDTIEFYRPPPAAGTRVPVRVEVVEFDRDARRVACNIEVQDGAGQVWFRVRGWQDVLFRWSRELLDVQRLPCQHLLAREVGTGMLPGEDVAVLLPRTLLRDAQIDRLARLYLHGDEWPAFQALDASFSHRKEWLMGRIAAKDAIRLWLARRDGGEQMHPSQVIIESEPSGRPMVRLVAGALTPPAVSIAHVYAGAVAAVSAQAMGIDLEAEAAGGALERRAFATAAEIRLLEAVEANAVDVGDDAQVASKAALWTTRLWCAKEAASKAMGTGLQGRPRAFEAVRVRNDGRFVLKHGEPAGWLEVTTWQDDGLIVAFASRATPLAARVHSSEAAS